MIFDKNKEKTTRNRSCYKKERKQNKGENFIGNKFVKEKIDKFIEILPKKKKKKLLLIRINRN